MALALGVGGQGHFYQGAGLLFLAGDADDAQEQGVGSEGQVDQGGEVFAADGDHLFGGAGGAQGFGQAQGDLGAQGAGGDGVVADVVDGGAAVGQDGVALAEKKNLK